jgi:hypothetical protein
MPNWNCCPVTNNPMPCKSYDHKGVVLPYLDYSQVFEIFTDASQTQLGAVITQANRPLAFFRRKLSETQQRYRVTKIELLAIVETLKEFKGMLWGQQVKVFTDHMNLKRDALGLTYDQVYWWRFLLEEYGPEIVCIKGIQYCGRCHLPVRLNPSQTKRFFKCCVHQS